MREMKAEFILIIFNGFQRGQLNIRMSGKAPRVKAPCIITSLTMYNLLCQQPAMTAPLANTGAQANNTIGIAFARYRPHQRCAVNRIGNRPVHHRVNTSIHQSRHTGKGPFQHICHPLQIIRTERIDKIRVNAIHAPCFTILLIKSEQQPLLFLPAVIIRNRTAQKRHTMTSIHNLLDGFGQEILMLHRHDRMMYAHHGPNLIHAVATGIHNNLTIYVTFGCMHSPAVILMLGEAGDSRMTVNFCAGFASTTGQRLTKLSRVNIPIQRIPEPPNQIFSGNERVAAGAFFCINHLEIHTHPTCHRGEMSISLHLAFGIGKPDTAISMMVVDRIIRIFSEFFIQRNRMALQPDHGLVHAKICDLRCRMPCRSGGEFITFHQHNIVPPFLCQMVNG